MKILPQAFKSTFKTINLPARPNTTETHLLHLVRLGEKQKKPNTESGIPFEWFFHIIKYSCDESKILSGVK